MTLTQCNNIMETTGTLVNKFNWTYNSVDYEVVTYRWTNPQKTSEIIEIAFGSGKAGHKAYGALDDFNNLTYSYGQLWFTLIPGKVS